MPCHSPAKAKIDHHWLCAKVSKLSAYRGLRAKSCRATLCDTFGDPIGICPRKYNSVVSPDLRVAIILLLLGHLFYEFAILLFIFLVLQTSEGCYNTGCFAGWLAEICPKLELYSQLCKVAVVE
jgi:hypothetical protein